MPNPVSLEFQEYSSGPSGANRDHLRNQFGTRSYRCQIRLAWNFRNYSRGPSGANRDHLRNQFGTRSHRDQTTITSEKNSDPGPFGNRYCSPGFSGIFQWAIRIKPRSPQNSIGTRSHRDQIRLAWNFRNYSRGPSGANRDHLRNQFGTRSHRCQIRLAWNFRHIPGGHREQTVITSEINSEPGPIDAKSG